jgi:hypothetical protein
MHQGIPSCRRYGLDPTMHSVRLDDHIWHMPLDLALLVPSTVCVVSDVRIQDHVESLSVSVVSVSSVLSVVCLVFAKQRRYALSMRYDIYAVGNRYAWDPMLVSVLFAWHARIGCLAMGGCLDAVRPARDSLQMPA